MVRTSVLRDALKCILNAERRGKRQVLLRPSSKVIVSILKIMKAKGYIDMFEIIDDHRASKIVVSLNGRINKCGVISPRFDISNSRIETTVQHLLPARQFGYVCFTTSSGILDHEDAQQRGTGGKILAYFF